jgi:hypothetical protein
VVLNGGCYFFAFLKMIQKNVFFTLSQSGKEADAGLHPSAMHEKGQHEIYNTGSPPI